MGGAGGCKGRGGGGNGSGDGGDGGGEMRLRVHLYVPSAFTPSTGQSYGQQITPCHSFTQGSPVSQRSLLDQPSPPVAKKRATSAEAI